jgi:uncharacterized protein with PIN domain
MDVVIDTSALVAVIVGEPERIRIIEVTSGNTLIKPVKKLHLYPNCTGTKG